MIKVLIVEDLHETGRWLTGLVNNAFTSVEVRHVQTLRAARAYISENRIGLALVDINLPDGSGIDFLTDLRKQSSDTYAVIVSIYDDPEHLFPAIRAGADGYLLKDQAEDIITDKLRGILKGDPPLSPGIARKMLEHFRCNGSSDPGNPTLDIHLTAREEEVLVMVARGLSRKEIAEILNLSIHTIAHYIKDLYRKLDVSTRAEAAIIACRMGLIEI